MQVTPPKTDGMPTFLDAPVSQAKSRKVIKIAIVGTGAVGATTFIHLVRRLSYRNWDRRLELHTFGDNPAVGSGVAYSTPKDFHVLNMRASQMSVFADDPQDFIAWLKQSHPDITPDYVPRRYFGSYLKTRYDEASSTACDHGIQVFHHQNEVVDCVETDDGVEVATRSETYVCDQAVFCLGHIPRISSAHLVPNNPKYIASPWDFARLAAIPPNATVGVIGTSLTAVDVIFSLVNSPFKGQIVCMSRKRGLPRVQSRLPGVELIHLTKANLCKLAEGERNSLSFAVILELLRRDFFRFPAGENLWMHVFDRNPVNDVVAVLREDLEKVESEELSWHSFLDSTSHLVPLIWHHFDKEERKVFLKIYDSRWAMYRHSMPERNARRLLAIAESGRLEVISGLSKIDFNRKTHKFSLSFVRGQQRHETTVDFLIDARGSGTALKDLDSELLRRMQQRGQIVADFLGGIALDFHSSRLRFRDGSFAERIRFVGPLTKGVHFYTNSYEMNRNNAMTIADKIVNEIVQDTKNRSECDYSIRS